MSLIPSHRHRPEDLDHWETLAAGDRAWGSLSRLDRMEARAMAALRAFRADGRFYLGVSWGKESIVVAHLAHRIGLDVPVIWFPAGPIENPDCALVRDAFLARFDVDYVEHEACDLAWTSDHGTMVHDGAQVAFAKATKRYGLRYASGVRGEESGHRKRCMLHWGDASPNTCAPIGFWSLEDVYGYLARHDLPIHPAYACTWGGTYPRTGIRVATIGGRIGRGIGRSEWEQSYYPETVRRVREMAAVAAALHAG